MTDVQQGLRQFFGGSCNRDEVASCEGFGNLRLMIVVMLAQLREPRHRNDMTTFAESRDKRTGSAVAHDDVSATQHVLNFCIGEGRLKLDVLHRLLSLARLNQNLVAYVAAMFQRDYGRHKTRKGQGGPDRCEQKPILRWSGPVKLSQGIKNGSVGPVFL